MKRFAGLRELAEPIADFFDGLFNRGDLKRENERLRQEMERLQGQVAAAEGAELVLHGHTHRADLSWIDTAAGRVPVIGAPACGMRPGSGYDAGAWRRLEISRHGSGWQLVLRERRAGSSGEMVDGPHLSFRLPCGAEVAGSAATP